MQTLLMWICFDRRETQPVGCFESRSLKGCLVLSAYFWLRQELKELQCSFVRASVQVCLELSFFIFLAQIFKQSVSSQSVSRQSVVSQQSVSSHSEVSQSAVSQQSVSSQSAVSQQSVSHHLSFSHSGSHHTVGAYNNSCYICFWKPLDNNQITGAALELLMSVCLSVCHHFEILRFHVMSWKSWKPPES